MTMSAIVRLLVLLPCVFGHIQADQINALLGENFASQPRSLKVADADVQADQINAILGENSLSQPRRLAVANVDLVDYIGLRVKNDASIITFGRKQDIKLYR